MLTYRFGCDKLKMVIQAVPDICQNIERYAAVGVCAVSAGTAGNRKIFRYNLCMEEWI